MRHMSCFILHVNFDRNGHLTLWRHLTSLLTEFRSRSGQMMPNLYLWIFLDKMQMFLTRIFFQDSRYVIIYLPWPADLTKIAIINDIITFLLQSVIKRQKRGSLFWIWYEHSSKLVLKYKPCLKFRLIKSFWNLSM